MDARHRTLAAAALAGIVVIALVYRAIPALGHYHKADAIVIAIMAHDIARGIAFPLVYYGQYYMGAIEAWITAPLFMITGPTWWGISFAPVLVSTIGVIPFYLLGRSLGGTAAGIAAALLWAVTPFAATFYSVTPRGCYPEVVCGGTAALWFATERWKGKTAGALSSWLFGLLLGLLLWTSLLSIPYIVAAGLFTALADQRTRRTGPAIAALIGFGAGAAPMFFAAGLLGGAGDVGLARFYDRLTGLFATAQSLFLPYREMSPPEALTWLGWAALALMTASLMAVTYHWIVKRAASKTGVAAEAPTLLFTALFLFLYLLNDRSLQMQSRYLLPLFTPLIVSTALAFEWLWTRRREAAVASLAVVLVSNAAINDFTFRSVNQHSDDERRFMEQAVREFKRIGLTSVVWVDYERVHRLDYEAIVQGVELYGVSSDGSRVERITWSAEKDPDTGVVLTAYPEALKRQLKACCGERFRVDKVIKWDVLSRMRPVTWPAESVEPSRWLLTGKQAPLGDRKFSSSVAWTDSFTIQLDEALPVTRIRAIYGGRQPERTAIQLSMDGKTWTEASPHTEPSIFLPAGPKVFVRSLMEGGRYEREYQEWNFPPTMARFIRFDIQNPSSKLYDIHELFIYESQPSLADNSPPPAASVCEAARAADVSVLAANRWISATLFGQDGCSIDYLKPTLRPVTDPWQRSDLNISRGLGALTGAEDTRELERRLQTAGIDYDKRTLGGYTLLSLNGPSGRVWWTGFTLIDY